MSKKQLTEQEKIEQVKKDLFWRTFFLMFFAGSFAFANLSQYKWYNGVFTVIIVILCVAGVIFLPNWFYKQKWVQEQYDIFQNKKWRTASDDKEKAKAKVYYNIIVFFGLAFISYILSGVLSLYVFNKDNTIRMLVFVVLMIISLATSIFWTERQSKQKEQ
jgi:sugar phosphate permease